MDPVAERLFALVDEQYKEQKAFAAAIGETPSKVSQWRMGITKSYHKRLPQIAEALGTTTEYLLTGEGPKKKSAPAVSDSDTKPDWMTKFEELSPGAQKEVIAFIEFKRGQE